MIHYHGLPITPATAAVRAIEAARWRLDPRDPDYPEEECSP